MTDTFEIFTTSDSPLRVQRIMFTRHDEVSFKSCSWISEDLDIKENVLTYLMMSCTT